jgi:hypothetical protein
MPILPLAQLGYLFVRTIAKPVATAIKNRMKHHPTFKKGCVGMAQTYHRWERRMKVHMMGIQVVQVQPLSEEKAIELGANMLSESILFTIAGVLIYVDFTRRSAKEKEKEANKIEALIALQQELHQMRYLLHSLQQDHQEEHYKLKSWNFLFKKGKSKSDVMTPARTLPMDQTVETVLSDRNVAVTAGMWQHSISGTVSAEEKLQSMTEALNMEANRIRIEKDHVEPVKEKFVTDEEVSRTTPKPWYYRSFKWLIATVDDILDDFKTQEDEAAMTIDISTDELMMEDTADISGNSS